VTLAAALLHNAVERISEDTIIATNAVLVIGGAGDPGILFAVEDSAVFASAVTASVAQKLAAMASDRESAKPDTAKVAMVHRIRVRGLI
jgi:hypothetical protein